MSYEIPKNLKYSEKIIFNLSLVQAGWIGLFGLLATGIFTKTPLPFEIKVASVIVLGLLGAGFAFFDLRKHLATLIGFLLKPRRLGYLDKRMAGFLDVKKIESDSIYLKKGSIKAVVQVQPINFHILSKKQKEAIINAYRDFLNSLDFPIQIVMRTVNLNLDDYLQQLELRVRTQKKEQLLAQFNEFQEFMRDYIEKNAVKNRLFYIIIPFEKSGKNAQSQLDIRVKLCQEKLKSCNLVTKRLNTNELISLLSSYFEGFVEAENEYQSAITLLERQESVVPNQKMPESLQIDNVVPKR